LLEDAQALAGDLIELRGVADTAVPGGKDQRPLASKGREIVDPAVQVARKGDGDEEGLGDPPRQSGSC